MTNWLSPINKVRWHKAFCNHAKSVQLTDGRKFSIRYETMRSKVTDEEWEVAHVIGPNVQDPSGYLRMSVVTKEDWIYTDETKTSTDSLYVNRLEVFLKSKDEGVDVRVEWPELKDRNRETLRRGFNNAIIAIGKRAKKVNVLTQGDLIYLIKADADD